MELLMSIVYEAILGILAHYVGESLPRGWFHENKFPYRPYSFEHSGKLYEKLGIRGWKTKVPDMSRYMKDMLPKRITARTRAENVDALIKETCVAECIHFFLCVLSFGIILIWKNAVGAVLFLICILCNLPFILIQRYNRPHLVHLRDRLRNREENRHAISDLIL